MKILKKVQVVPLDENYGKIIDSFNTADDKTKNAPSINAVENYVGDYVEENVLDFIDDELIPRIYLKDDYAILTGAISSGSSPSVSINYPTGFTKDNCVVLSISTQYAGGGGNGTWGTGSVFTVAGVLTGNFPIRVFLKTSEISIQVKDIRISNGAYPIVEDVPALNYKLVLLKIS